MRKPSYLLLLLMPFCSWGQKTAIRVYDILEVKNEFEKEALYFYEQNWKLFRDMALSKGFITEFSLERAPKSDSSFTIILSTGFSGKEQFENVEQHFEPIMKSIRLGGPVVMGTADFRSYFLSRQSFESNVLTGQ